MADISKITVGGETYNVKDKSARQSVDELVVSLGNLAYKDEATGSFTPTGTVSAPSVDVNVSTTQINSLTSIGSLPNWSASVSEETLEFSFSQGSLPHSTGIPCVTAITDVTATQPIFSGNAGTVTVN